MVAAAQLVTVCLVVRPGGKAMALLMQCVVCEVKFLVTHLVCVRAIALRVQSVKSVVLVTVVPMAATDLFPQQTNADLHVTL